MFAAFAQRTGEKEDGIQAAHFCEDWNGFLSRCCGIEERTPCAQRTGEAERLCERMTHECERGVCAGAMDEREYAVGQIILFNRAVDRRGGEFGGAGMRGMRLHDDCAACGECGGGVTSGDGECEREIARAEHYDWPERNEHPAQVGTWNRLTVWQRSVYARIHPRAFADECGESLELSACAPAFSSETVKRQTGFEIRSLE